VNAFMELQERHKSGGSKAPCFPQKNLPANFLIFLILPHCECFYGRPKPQKNGLKGIHHVNNEVYLETCKMQTS
jgi:hypothetical protein